MSRGQGGPGDLRGSRWKLQPVQRKLEAEVESARLGLALLLQQSHALEAAERRGLAQHRQQQALALQTAQRDVYAGAQAVRYLARLEGERIAAAAQASAMQERVRLAREACAQRQRQLETVQALRSAAERDHAQARLRQECKEADAAWLGLAQLRRCAALRQRSEAK